MDVEGTWTWLRSSPLLGVALTVAAYQLGRTLQARAAGTRWAAVVQPVLVAIVVIGVALWLLDVDYEEYLSGASLIGFLLGPATVALAVPLHRQAHHLRSMALPLLVAIPAGAAVSVFTGYGLVRLLGGGEQLALSLAPKSATTPVSIALSETLGGLPSLTAALTIAIGITGAVAGPAALDLLRIRDPHARGVALGGMSHGIGTSRALQEHPVEGAFSGLSMGLTALATSLVVPLLLLL